MILDKMELGKILGSAVRNSHSHFVVVFRRATVEAATESGGQP
jgi:hypothetical protein